MAVKVYRARIRGRSVTRTVRANNKQDAARILAFTTTTRRNTIIFSDGTRVNTVRKSNSTVLCSPVMSKVPKRRNT